MKAIQFFEQFLEQVKQTAHWKTMCNTVENSPWHREANVAVHTLMTLDVYWKKFAPRRSEREQLLTSIALLFHDFGKPEAEEEVEKKDGSGDKYRRYAGHEPISANEFMSFICDHPDLRKQLFDQGLTWPDMRRIKVMIEHHLPYGLKNEQKRKNLREMISRTLGGISLSVDGVAGLEMCYYDMLRSDAAGRISDDHEQKLQAVEDWINEFQLVTFKPTLASQRKFNGLKGIKPFAMSINSDGSTTMDFSCDFKRQPMLTLLVGVSGAGKSTWIAKQHRDLVVFSEDDLRMEYAKDHFNELDHLHWSEMTKQEQYDAAWKFCHMNKDSKFDAFSKAKFLKLLEEGRDVVIDRMNQGRKGRSMYIQAAKDRGYHVHSVEFYISESTALKRQQTRGDKRVPDYRVHQIIMQLETPWLGPEVDSFAIIPPT